MTQLLDMLQLNFFFFLKLFPRTHTRAGAAFPARHVTAPYQLCSIQVLLHAWTPTAVLSNVSDDKHCVKVSELYACPFPLICFVFTPDYCSTPYAFVLVTQLPPLFFQTIHPFFSSSSYPSILSHPADIIGNRWSKFGNSHLYPPLFYLNSFFPLHSASSVAVP